MVGFIIMLNLNQPNKVAKNSAVSQVTNYTLHWRLPYKNMKNKYLPVGISSPQ